MVYWNQRVLKIKAVLTYHVVSGKFDAATVIDAINKKTENIPLLLYKVVKLFKFDGWK
jgi:uncharacterized surface protein with fasciclin (FAS1) repeats